VYFMLFLYFITLFAFVALGLEFLGVFLYFQYINIVLHHLAVYVRVILKPPTASWHFWGSGAGRLAVCQGCGSSVEYLARKARLAGLANLRAQLNGF